MSHPIAVDATGRVTAWLDAAGRHDTRSGSEIITPLDEGERRLLTVATLRQGITRLQQARDAAQAQAQSCTARATAAGTVATQETTRKQQVAASTPALTVAYLSAVRDELALIHGRLAQVADAVAALSRDEALAAQGVALAYEALIYLARMASDDLASGV